MLDKTIINRLNKRITVQIKTIKEDGFGGCDEIWTDLKNIWGEIKPISNCNNFEANKVEEKTTHIITIRYYKDLTTQNRIKYNNRIFNIIGIINNFENNKIVEIKVEESMKK